jgi:hypothetical protein
LRHPGGRAPASGGGGVFIGRRRRG